MEDSFFFFSCCADFENVTFFFCSSFCSSFLLFYFSSKVGESNVESSERIKKKTIFIYYTEFNTD